MVDGVTEEELQLSSHGGSKPPGVPLARAVAPDRQRSVAILFRDRLEGAHDLPDTLRGTRRGGLAISVRSAR